MSFAPRFVPGYAVDGETISLQLSEEIHVALNVAQLFRQGDDVNLVQEIRSLLHGLKRHVAIHSVNVRALSTKKALTQRHKGTEISESLLSVPPWLCVKFS